MNTTGPGFTPEVERRHQARIWYIQRRPESKNLPPTLEKQWRKWSRDPANRIAYSDFARLHSMLLSVPPPPSPSAAEMHADSPDALRLAPDSSAVPDRKMTSSRWARPLVQVWAACAVAAIIVLAWVAPRIPGLIDITLAETLTYATPPGVPREITLPDHSIVTLSGSARLTASFSKHRRSLVLTEGEVFFKVRHDPAAPFQVEAGSARIVDVGTTFDVRRYSDRVVVVSVAEGAVTVIPDTHANATDTPVKGGEQVTYDAKGEVSRPHLAAPESSTSWLFGRRNYHGQPLSKVIEDVQLYVPLQIDLDRALESVRFSGFIDKLDSQRAEAWVRGLHNIYPVEVDVNSHRMFIRCSKPGCPGIHP